VYSTFVEDDNLKGWIGIGYVLGGGVAHSGRRHLGRRGRNGQGGKVFDLVPDHTNAAFVGRVEFEDTAFPIGRRPQLTTQSERDRGLYVVRSNIIIIMVRSRAE
jgi:hypothetical protein